MDKSSKKILSFLKKSKDMELWFDDEIYKNIGLSPDEFRRSAKYLDSVGLVEYIRNQHGMALGITLTHHAVHSSYFKFASFKEWAFKSFFGGVITGVFSTLVAEGLLYLCVKLVQYLCSQ